MTEANPQAIKLQDYKKPEFSFDELLLDFDLFEDKAIVTAKTSVTKIAANANLFLNGEDLKLLSVELNEKVLTASDYKLDKKSLTILNPPQKFNLVIKTEIHPQNNKAFSGLYKTKNIFCTQMEAEGFRRVTFLPDMVLNSSLTTPRSPATKANK